MVIRTIFVILICFLLSGCFSCEPLIVREPVEVKVPVPVKAKPHKTLLTDISVMPLPVFVLPSDKNASSALTPEGETRLKKLLVKLKMRIEAWREWATAGDPNDGE